MSIEFDDINDLINQFDWYSFPLKMQQMLPFILANAQQPVGFECFGSFACNRELFRKVKFYKTWNAKLKKLILWMLGFFSGNQHNIFIFSGTSSIWINENFVSCNHTRDVYREIRGLGAHFWDPASLSEASPPRSRKKAEEIFHLYWFKPRNIICFSQVISHNKNEIFPEIGLVWLNWSFQSKFVCKFNIFKIFMPFKIKIEWCFIENFPLFWLKTDSLLFID